MARIPPLVRPGDGERVLVGDCEMWLAKCGMLQSMACMCGVGPDTAGGARGCGADGAASEEDALAATEEAGLNRGALASLLQDAGGALASAYTHIAAACRWGPPRD